MTVRLRMFGVASILLAGLSACGAPDSATPSRGSTAAAIVTSTTAEAAPAALPTSVDTSTTAEAAPAALPTAVDTMQSSTPEPAAQSPGQTSPGSGAASGMAQASPESGAQQPDLGTMKMYTDATSGFQIQHPDRYVINTRPRDDLASLMPAPKAAIQFMKASLAASDNPALEAADLEIRVYDAGPDSSLAAWLASNNIVPADAGVPLKEVKLGHTAASELCASTMIAPGCMYFVLANQRVYQLTPASLEGEAMLQTFTPIP